MAVELHAVVESETSAGAPWFVLPAKPWPRFVRLWGATPAEDVALFVGVLFGYGRHEPRLSIDELLAEFPEVLPGGVAVVAGDRSIEPGCCCGLESWTEWRQVLVNGQSPWTGHDPSPLVEVVEDVVQVWSDGGMSERPLDEVPVGFSRQDLATALERVAQDLEDFLVPLRGWLDVNAPAQSNALVAKFSSVFVER